VRKLLVGLAVLLVGLPVLGDDAKNKPKSDRPKSPEEQYQALVKEYDTAMKEYRAAIAQAKTDEDRQKAANEKRPKPNEFGSRMLELAQKNPKESAAVDALVWIISHFAGDVNKACELLLNHSQDKRLADVVENFRYSFTPAMEKLLRAVLEKSRDRSAQGRACFVLASAVKDKKEADRFRSQLLEMFADVTNRGGALLVDALNAPQFEKEHLAIGKTVPEIEGADIDGKKFKLSDYRGKVVLLDFWGNW
jgi:hypothetical protein